MSLAPTDKYAIFQATYDQDLYVNQNGVVRKLTDPYYQNTRLSCGGTKKFPNITQNLQGATIFT